MILIFTLCGAGSPILAGFKHPSLLVQTTKRKRTFLINTHLCLVTILAFFKHPSLFVRELETNSKCIFTMYEESVVDKFKSNLLLMIFWLHVINYNS